MEHWLVALGPGQNDAVLEWAARHAEGRAALEVIASGLEVADPRAAVLRAANRLLATRARVPRALHTVPRSLAEELAGSASVDLVVLVPGAGSDDDAEPLVITWPASGGRPPAALRAAVQGGRGVVRVERAPHPAQIGVRP